MCSLYRTVADTRRNLPFGPVPDALGDDRPKGRVETNGGAAVPYDDTQSITLKVVAPQVYAAVNRVNPLPPAAAPLPGTGPIQNASGAHIPDPS